MRVFQSYKSHECNTCYSSPLLLWLSIQAAYTLGGVNTITKARTGLGVKATELSSDPYLMTAAPANAPAVRVVRNMVVEGVEDWPGVDSSEV